MEDGENAYMAGWARRSESPTSTRSVSAWAGNLVVQKIIQKENGDLALAPADTVMQQFQNKRRLMVDNAQALIEADSTYQYIDVCTCYERFLLKGNFTYSGSGSFGLCFDYNGETDKYKLISICPDDNLLQLSFNKGGTPIAETEVHLESGKEYSFSYIQEGSVGVFYIDDMAALTVRLYGVSGKPIKLFAENNSVTFSALEQYSN